MGLKVAPGSPKGSLWDCFLVYLGGLGMHFEYVLGPVPKVFLRNSLDIPQVFLRYSFDIA